MLDFIKITDEFQKRFDFEIPVVECFEQISAYMSPAASDLAVELMITDE